MCWFYHFWKWFEVGSGWACSRDNLTYHNFAFRKACTTTILCNSAMVQQCYGAMVLRCNDATVLRCNGAMVLRCNSATVLRCYSAMVQQCNSAALQYVCINKVLQRIWSLPHNCHTDILHLVADSDSIFYKLLCSANISCNHLVRCFSGVLIVL